MADATVARRGLFRRESLQTRASAWQGQPSLRLGLPATFTTIAAVAVAAALSALLAFGSYARRLDLDGAVLPTAGLIAISAPSIMLYNLSGSTLAAIAALFLDNFAIYKFLRL